MTESTWAILTITRFFLAFIVLIHHLDYYFGMVKGNMVLEFIPSLGGKSAILGFLLISGISIGYSFFINSVGFLKRRFLRIYPLYFFAVFLGVFAQYFLGSPYQLSNVNIGAAVIGTSISSFLLLARGGLWHNYIQWTIVVISC
jgi:peptidoglycan/LPS O-acetylase OafA/YrhL